MGKIQPCDCNDVPALREALELDIKGFCHAASACKGLLRTIRLDILGPAKNFQVGCNLEIAYEVACGLYYYIGGPLAVLS